MWCLVVITRVRLDRASCPPPPAAPLEPGCSERLWPLGELSTRTRSEPGSAAARPPMRWGSLRRRAAGRPSGAGRMRAGALPGRGARPPRAAGGGTRFGAAGGCAAAGGVSRAPVPARRGAARTCVRSAVGRASARPALVRASVPGVGQSVPGRRAPGAGGAAGGSQPPSVCGSVGTPRRGADVAFAPGHSCPGLGAGTCHPPNRFSGPHSRERIDLIFFLSWSSPGTRRLHPVALGRAASPRRNRMTCLAASLPLTQ